MGAWTVNPEALEEARKVLGITLPVRIRLLESGPQNMAGKYHGIGLRGPTTDEPLDSPAHHITVKAEMTPGMANTCLKHELVHASQGERYLPENGDYRVANAELGKAFGREMKEMRQRKGTKSKDLWGYSEVSFETEAHSADKLLKDIDLIDVNDPRAAGGTDLLALMDEHGRYTWRVDVWKDGKWNKKRKMRDPNTFCQTIYVLAKDDYGAKRFARDECKLAFQDSTCDAYMVKPFKKKEGSDNGSKS
jgi:hypothetical protein